MGMEVIKNNLESADQARPVFKSEHPDSSLQATHVPVIGVERDGRVDVWNPAMERLSGLSFEAAQRKHIVADIAPLFIPGVPVDYIQRILDAALNGEVGGRFRSKTVTVEGEDRWINFAIDPRFDATGETIGAFALLYDETDLVTMRLENVLYASEFIDFIESATAPIIGVTCSGRINEWNKVTERLTGYPKSEAVGKNLVDDFVGEANKDLVRDVLQRAAANQETPSYDLELISKSGHRKHLLMNATPRRSLQGNVCCVIGIGQDITERLARESAELNRAKLESIGSLTGGIAHDFNNLLTVISGNLSLLEARDSSDLEILEDARKAAADGAELVRSLLAFSRQQQLTPRSHEVSFLLEQFQRSIVRSLGDQVTLKVCADDIPGTVFVDRSQFEAALLNICINAAEAMGRSGTLTIAGSLLDGVPNLLCDFGIEEARTEHFLLLQFTDTGCGIPEADIDKVTQPFFTTKQDSGGAGLGLSSVSGFVDQSGGGLRIDSELGVGTKVQLLLPYSARQPCETARGDDGAKISLKFGISHRVMVVDDEAGVRKLVSRWLSRLGYQVVQADSADQALQLLEDLGGAVDVVFSDVVMPGRLDGIALAKRVSERWPHIGLLLATGYDQDRRFHDGGSAQLRFPILSKPYDLKDLGLAISEQVRLHAQA